MSRLFKTSVGYHILDSDKNVFSSRRWVWRPRTQWSTYLMGTSSAGQAEHGIERTVVQDENYWDRIIFHIFSININKLFVKITKIN